MTEKQLTDFDLFWATYPKRAGQNPKAPAQKKFDLAVRDGVDPTDIITGARRYAEEEKDSIGTRFIAHAVTWLNQKRWQDYQFQAKVPTVSNVGSQFFVKEDSDQWKAWQGYLRNTTGKGSPCRNFGWWFPSEWPPETTHP